MSSEDVLLLLLLLLPLTQWLRRNVDDGAFCTAVQAATTPATRHVFAQKISVGDGREEARHKPLDGMSL